MVCTFNALYLKSQHFMLAQIFLIYKTKVSTPLPKENKLVIKSVINF